MFRFVPSALSALGCCLLLACAGCSMISSNPTAGFLDSPTPPQAANSYFVAKHNLRVTVVGTTPATASLNVTIVAGPDRRQLLDTGMNLSAFSDDDITIETHTNGLLKQITATAHDRTAEIIQTLTKVVHSPLLRLGEAPASQTFFEGDFDPFDLQQAVEMNRLLARFRSCVEVELAPGIWSPGCQRGSLRIAHIHDAELPRVDLVVPGPGIYYRRPIAHRVHVVERGRSRSLTNQLFANAAPLLRVDIDRTAFVKRETTIVFDGGAPTSVKVVKPSEALELAKLPLTIATAAIDAPIEGLTKRKDLIAAETQLLQAEASKREEEAKLQQLVNSRIAAGAAPIAVGSDGMRVGFDPGFVNGTSRAAGPGDVPADYRARCAQLRLNDFECLTEFQKGQR